MIARSDARSPDERSEIRDDREIPANRVRQAAPAFTASFIEDRHVVEVPSHLGVARTERLLADGQRALEESPPPLRTCPGRGPDFQGG